MKLITSDQILYYKKSFLSKKWVNCYFSLTSDGIIERYKYQDEEKEEATIDVKQTSILVGDDVIGLDDRPPLELWMNAYLLMRIPEGETGCWWLLFMDYPQMGDWMENISLTLKANRVQQDFIIKNRLCTSTKDEFCNHKNTLKYRDEAAQIPPYSINVLPAMYPPQKTDQVDTIRFHDEHKSTFHTENRETYRSEKIFEKQPSYRKESGDSYRSEKQPCYRTEKIYPNAFDVKPDILVRNYSRVGENMNYPQPSNYPRKDSSNSSNDDGIRVTVHREIDYKEVPIEKSESYNEQIEKIDYYKGILKNNSRSPASSTCTSSSSNSTSRSSSSSRFNVKFIDSDGKNRIITTQKYQTNV